MRDHTGRSPLRAAAGAPGFLAAALAVVVALTACQPSTEPFPMPDEFPQPANEALMVDAVACPSTESLADAHEPDSDDWVRAYETALEASAMRTMFASPEIVVAPGEPLPTRDDNPWGLAPEVYDDLADPTWWEDLCDTADVDRDALTSFNEVLFDAPLGLTADLTTMVGPSLAPYRDQ